MRNEGKTNGEKLITTKDLAELLDLSARRVQQLAEEGVLIRAEKGKYKLLESVHRYIKHVQNRSHDDDVDYFSERAKHERAKREKAELQVAVMRGELHRAEDVKDVMTDMLAAIRAKLLSLPAKIAPR
uniref:hypothetical protein n=1 Tax=Gorillibacterium sp. sgz5001074 TaxID=3446695 RepID=UPI003F6809D1